MPVTCIGIRDKCLGIIVLKKFKDPQVSILKNLLAALAGAILLILGFLFSVLIIVAIAAVGLAGWGYLLWKFRKLRRATPEQAQNGQVIEGEAVVVEEYPPAAQHILPGDRPEI